MHGLGQLHLQCVGLVKGAKGGGGMKVSISVYQTCQQYLVVVEVHNSTNSTTSTTTTTTTTTNRTTTTTTLLPNSKLPRQNSPNFQQGGGG
jgi:hypothetical protein